MRLFAKAWRYAAILLLLAVGGVHGQDTSGAVLQTLVELWDYQHQGMPKGRRIAFEFPESIVNTYLALSLKLRPRPGIQDLAVELLPNNRILVTAGIDYNGLLRSDPGLVPAKLYPRMVRARRLRAEFQFLIRAGLLVVSVKPISLDGLEVPAPVLEKIVHRIAAIQPEKVDASRPLPVPFGLQRLYTARGVLGGATY